MTRGRTGLVFLLASVLLLTGPHLVAARRLHLKHPPGGCAAGAVQSRGRGLAVRGGAAGVRDSSSAGAITVTAPGSSTRAPKERFVSDLQNEDSRRGFIRKVYSILTVQLLATFGLVLWASLHKRTNPLIQWLFSARGPVDKVLWASFGVTFGSRLLLRTRPSLQTNPVTSFGLLALFTAAESVMVTIFSLMYKPRSVVAALFQTLMAAGGLTLYAASPNPNFDMTGLRQMLTASMSALLGLALMSFFFGFSLPEGLYSTIAALTFCGYIVYDTKTICDGTHPEHQLNSNQYVLGAIELYVDIIGLFVHILSLFGESEN